MESKKRKEVKEDKKRQRERETKDTEMPKKKSKTEKKTICNIKKQKDKKQSTKRKRGKEEEQAKPVLKKKIKREQKENKDAIKDKKMKEEKSGENKGILAGKVFLLLGRFATDRIALKKSITLNGGRVMDHISTQVTHLLCAEGDDGTKTFKQARMKGLKIIPEDRLLRWLDHNRENLSAESKSLLSFEENKRDEEKENKKDNENATTEHNILLPFTPVKSDFAFKRIALDDASPSW
jgi:hypothetical protein